MVLAKMDALAMRIKYIFQANAEPKDISPSSSSGGGLRDKMLSALAALSRIQTFSSLHRY
jgi:hypothetical protein